jgi:hypothetical protein
MGDPRVRFRFDRTERSLTAEEARVLADLLVDARSDATTALAARLRAHFRDKSDTPMNLERAEVAALREALDGADVRESVGLKLLQQAL